MRLSEILTQAAGDISREMSNILGDATIKTDDRKKRRLVDMWNWTLTRYKKQAESPYIRAVLSGYYNAVTNTIAEELTVEEFVAYMEVLTRKLECNQPGAPQSFDFIYMDDTVIGFIGKGGCRVVSNRA